MTSPMTAEDKLALWRSENPAIANTSRLVMGMPTAATAIKESAIGVKNAILIQCEYSYSDLSKTIGGQEEKNLGIKVVDAIEQKIKKLCPESHRMESGPYGGIRAEYHAWSHWQVPPEDFEKISNQLPSIIEQVAQEMNAATLSRQTAMNNTTGAQRPR